MRKTMKRTAVAMVMATVLLAGGCAPNPPTGVLGVYRFPDGRVVSVRRSLDHTLRYREYETGQSGRLYPETELRYVSGPGFYAREPVVLRVRFDVDDTGVARAMEWSPTDGPVLEAQRVGRERPLRFESDGVTLSGWLHLPDGPGPYPGVVLVGGSGETPATEWLYNGDFYVAHGVAVLAYDKRGTGGSGGDFTFDFHRLARDAAAAVELLAVQPEIRADRVGLSGYSQGGWVAPLAASMSRASYVSVSYGMIESPAAEARLEMLQLLEDAEVSGPELAAADSLVTAAVDVVAGGLTTGWEAFDRLKERHDDAAWLEYLDGTPVDRMVHTPRWLVKLFGRGQLPPGLRWRYDSTELLESLCIPMTWLLGGADRSAPNEGTIATLRTLEAEGLPYELLVFPGTDHSMLVFDEEDGRRIYTGYAPGYHRAEVEAALQWAEGAGPELPVRCR